MKLPGLGVSDEEAATSLRSSVFSYCEGNLRLQLRHLHHSSSKSQRTGMSAQMTSSARDKEVIPTESQQYSQSNKTCTTTLVKHANTEGGTLTRLHSSMKSCTSLMPAEGG